MTAALESSYNFANLQGLQSLRDSGDTPEARRAIARQFESMFLNLMMQQMRSASNAIDGGLIDKGKLDMQQSMLDQQLALSLSKSGSLGIADSILRSLGDPAGNVRPNSAGAGYALAPPATATATSTALAAREAGIALPAATDRPGRASAADSTVATRFSAETPAAFVESLRPHAERAAERLGIPADALIAQAALETGWGTSLPANQYGESSFNLFGIKAGTDWIGPRAVVATQEFINGQPEQRQAAFRMYSNIAESFDDYAGFVTGKARYSQAIAADTPEAYFRGLQQAGYATDPDYADKILGILARGLPGGAVAAVGAADKSPRETSMAQHQVAASRADILTDGGRL